MLICLRSLKISHNIVPKCYNIKSCMEAFFKFLIQLSAQKRKNEDVELPLFRLTTIAAATNNFSQENLIGRGGFGPVYKVTLDMFLFFFIWTFSVHQ